MAVKLVDLAHSHFRHFEKECCRRDPYIILSLKYSLIGLYVFLPLIIGEDYAIRISQEFFLINKKINC